MLQITEGLSDEEIARIHLEVLGIPEEETLFRLAVERGELPTGDLLFVDENGKPLDPGELP